MTLIRILALLLATCALGQSSGAQVVVRDHRLGNGVKYIPRQGGTHIVTSGPKTPVPPSVASFPVDPQFREEIALPGNGQALLMNNPNQVFFANRLRCSSGNVASSSGDAGPKELMFLADTLTVDGLCTVDLSANRTNENGFLFIACRILDLRTGGQLTVSLSGRQIEKYRKFFLFAERIFLDGKKVFDEAAVLQQFIRHNDRYDPLIVAWRRLRVGEVLPPGLPATSIKNGMVLDTIKFNPLQISVGFLPTMSDVHPAFFSYFSRWVAASYENLDGKIARDETAADKMRVVRDYMKFLALNRYDNLEPASQARCTDLVKKINSEKDRIFKNGFQFERTVPISGRQVRMLSSLKEDGIVNYIPPSLALVNPSWANGRTLLGYRIFDESQPNASTLDFDVVFSGDTRLKEAVEAALTANDDTVSLSYEEMKFSDFRVQGADILPSSSVTVVGNSLLNVRLGMNNATTLIFNRLFAPLGSGIQLSCRWANDSGEITGDIQIPLSFARMANQPIVAKDGGITNSSSLPVVVEFFQAKGALVDKSPGVAIDTGQTVSGLYTDKNAHVNIPPDGLLFKLDPSRFGDYFEQIDNSDRVTQEIVIENHLSAAPTDSLSGFMEYADVKVAYTVNDRNFVRRAQLAPANALGDRVTLAILKNTKDAVPLMISGKAIYENGERDISEVTLSNGESRFDLQEINLKSR